jgi:hypothetical protein
MCPIVTAGLCLSTSPTDPAAGLLTDAATTRVDGKKATPSTVWRHRTILGNAMDYARELRLRDTKPIPWAAGRGSPPSAQVEASED